MNDRQYFDLLYQTYYGPLRKLAHMILRGAGGHLNRAAISEEIVQETFLVALARLQAIRASPHSGQWLMVTQKHLLRKTMIRKLRHQAFKAPAEYWEDPNGLLFLLPDYCGETEETLWKLHYDQGYSMKRVANVMDLTPVQCHKQLKKLRQKLRALSGRGVGT